MTIRNRLNILASAALDAIQQIDLSGPRRKLMMPAPEGNGWSAEQASEAEQWYRNYLLICAKYPGFPAVPNAPIDEFWHAHILDTRAYARDCDAIFGSYLHHYPYFGLNGDTEERDAAFDETNRLYRMEFGEDCTTMRFSAASHGEGCNGSGGNGGGTGCGQHRNKLVTAGAGCGQAGTGCGNRCGRR